MAIESNELVRLDDFRAEIARSKADYQEWIDSAKNLNLVLLRSMQSITDELQRIRAQVQGGIKGEIIGDLAGRASELTTQLGNQRSATAALAQVDKQYETVVTSLNERLEKLINEYAQLDTTEKAAQKRAKELSREMSSITAELAKVGKSAKVATDGAKEVTGQYNKLQKELSEAKRDLKALDDAFDKNTGALNKNNAAAVALATKIQIADRALKQMDSGIGVYTRNVGNYGNKFTNLIGGTLNGGVGGLLTKLGLFGAAFLAITGPAEAAISAIGEVGQQYEKLDLLLTNAFSGNVKSAERAKKVITEFSNQSPLEIDEVTSSFTRLLGIGIEPTVEELNNLSDVAISKGKSLSDYVEAIADAQTGEFERLKEFGIRAKKEGDKVVFTYNGISKSVDNSAASISKYLIEMGKTPGIAGATAALAESTSGKLSTMGDKFKEIADKIFRFFKPAIDFTITGLTTLADKASKLFNSASENAVSALNEQTAAMNKLENQIPTLLSRYDQLKSKTSLTKNEQQEFRTVVNQLANIVPEASKGVDNYGNALDINRDKVLQFTAAQRQLNAELNKEANNQLQREADLARGRIKVNQEILKRGSEYTTDPLGRRVESPITAKRRAELQKEIAESRKVIENSAAQIQQQGGKLNQATREYIKQSGSMGAQQLMAIDDITNKIAQKEAQAAVMLKKGQMKERAELLKEIEALKKQRQELISPGSTTPSVTPSTTINKPGKTTDQLRAEADRRLNESIAKVEAQTKTRLAELDRQVEERKISAVEANAKQRDIELAGLRERQQLLRKAGKQSTADYEKTKTEEQEIQTRFLKERNKQEDEAWKKAVESVKSGLEKIDQQYDSGLRDQLTELDEWYQEQRAIIERAKEARVITEQQANERLYNIRVDYLQNIAAATTSALENEKAQSLDLLKTLEANAKTEAEIKELADIKDKLLSTNKAEREKALAELQKKLAKETADAQITEAERVANDAKKKAQQRKETEKEVRDYIAQILQEGVSGFFEITSAYRDIEMRQLEKQKEYELSLVEGNDDAKKLIEQRYAARQREIRRRQAIADKAAAIFQIAISTAVAAMNSAAIPGVGLALVPFIIGLGAIQAAIVAAKPIPEFFRGTSDAPEGPAWVGERGAELIQTKDKSGKTVFRLAAEKQVMYLQKHDKVYTAQETKRMIEVDNLYANEMRKNSPSSSNQKIIEAIRSGLSKGELTQAFKEAIADLPVSEQHWNERGYQRYTRNGNGRVQEMNDYFSLPKSNKK